MRAERVPGRDGSTLGYFVILFDLRQTKRAAAARRHLEQSIALAGRALAGDTAVGAGAPVPDPVLCAIFGNARLAAMDIADNTTGPPAAPLLEELEAATQRAAALYARIRDLGGSGG
jgi:hypothetical protein